MKKTQKQKQIETIKKFFSENDIPEEPIMLNKWTKLNNPKKFVEVHISMIEAMNDDVAEPYINRLRELGMIILNNKIKLNEQTNQTATT